MFSDTENLDIMLGENHFDLVEREESSNSNLARRPESANSNNFQNDGEDMHLNPRIINSGISTDSDRNSATANSSAEINRLSSELNCRISREMDEMMNSVNVHIQRAINDATSNQVLPHIPNVIMAGSGHMTKKGWNVPAERPETNTEGLRSEKARNDPRSEQTQGRQHNDPLDEYCAYDRYETIWSHQIIANPKLSSTASTPNLNLMKLSFKSCSIFKRQIGTDNILSPKIAKAMITTTAHHQ